jgi:DDE superfamily endonuclease/telomere resolvase
VKGKWVYLYRAVDSSGATIDFPPLGQRDAAAAERFLNKALGGENHPAPRVINTDEHDGYPPAIERLKADGVLKENCQHRPVQYLNNVLEQDHRAIKAPGPRQQAFPFVLGRLAYDRRLRGNSYDPQRTGPSSVGSARASISARSGVRGAPSPGYEAPKSVSENRGNSIGAQKKLPYPAVIFDGQLKTRQAPGTSFEPYPIPVLADPRNLSRPSTLSGTSKASPSPKAVNTTTGPQLPKYVSAAFGSLERPWKPGHLRSAYGALCCHKFKPKNQTDDIFLAQILGHKLLGPNASLSVGQSYKDFYIR